MEASIALSIMFVAAEIIRARGGGGSVMKRWPWIASFTFGLLHGFGFASALQEIGIPQDAVLTGTVTDSTGAVLPGVTVVAVNEATGNRFETVTDERGIYRMPARVGAYQISAELQGFIDDPLSVLPEPQRTGSSRSEAPQA